jgi:hypothetical protein
MSVCDFSLLYARTVYGSIKETLRTKTRSHIGLNPGLGHSSSVVTKLLSSRNSEVLWVTDSYNLNNSAPRAVIDSSNAYGYDSYPPGPTV